MLSVKRSRAQSALGAGTVAFTAYNCGNNGADTFGIILLVDITSCTEIIFTDGCYTDANGYFLFPAAATSDWAFRWVSGSAMTAGTQIKFWTSTVNCSGNCGANASTGTITWGRGLSLPSSGDQIFACQGGTIDTLAATRKYTPARVLSGIHTNLKSSSTIANWDVGATGTIESELPDSLVTYGNAIWHKYIGVGLGGEVDNLRYKCTSTTGTAAAMLAAIMDTTNWYYLDGLSTSFSPALCSDAVTEWNGTNWSWTGTAMTNVEPEQGIKAAYIGSSTTPGSFTTSNLFIKSGFDLTLGSGVTATIYGDFNNSGNGTSGVGTLRFAKTGTQTISGTAFSHAGVVDVATGATLATGGLLTLENGASLMHGTGTPNGGGSVSGSVTIQKTIGSNTSGWRMFSLPVDMLVDNFEDGLNTRCSNSTPADRWNVYYYDPTAGPAAPVIGNYALGWTVANNTTDDENKAYSIYLNDTSDNYFNFDNTVSVTGAPNEGTKTFNLQYTFDPASSGTSSTQRGWNQIPNYFPSNLGVYDLINDANFGTTYKAIHVWDQGSSQMIGLNQSSMNTYNNSGTSRFSTIRQIPPFMAFWVKATNTSQSIQVKNSMRTSRTDSLPANTYFKKDFDIFRVTVEDKEGKFDQFSVCFDEGATEGMDYTMDLYKFKSMAAEVPTLYTVVDNDNISFNAVPVKESYSMPLVIESSTNGKEYTFSPEVSHYSNYFDVELVDNKTGVKTQLLTNNYSFNYDAAFNGPRFTLNFYRKTSVSVDELFNQEKMYAYTNEGGINVVYNNNNSQARATVEVYNVVGQKLFTRSNVAGGETTTFKPSANGMTQVYFINITSDGKTKTVKVVY
ncbi:MAG TPA: T9SS type A sorting domain-containing protein [Bacteroidia bacterium]|nr:T9SS type A sorting domain-containing protein [Bacteroidia bacterium]